MGRIRSIKPELLTDAKAVKLSDTAWRLWVSSWLLADDAGNFPADLLILQGQIFPGRRESAIRKALGECAKAGLIGIYKVNGDTYGCVKGWSRHQKINRPSGPKFPTACGEFSEPSVSPHGALNADRDRDRDHDRDHDPSIAFSSKEKARRAGPTSTPMDASGSTPMDKSGGEKRAVQELASQWLDWFNRVYGRQFRLTETTLKNVQRIHRQGYGYDDLRRVAHHRSLLWLDDPKMASHHNPTTLLRRSHFENYLDEAREALDATDSTRDDDASD